MRRPVERSTHFRIQTFLVVAHFALIVLIVFPLGSTKDVPNCTRTCSFRKEIIQFQESNQNPIFCPAKVSIRFLIHSLFFFLPNMGVMLSSFTLSVFLSRDSLFLGCSNWRSLFRPLVSSCSLVLSRAQGKLIDERSGLNWFFCKCRSGRIWLEIFSSTTLSYW